MKTFYWNINSNYKILDIAISYHSTLHQIHLNRTHTHIYTVFIRCAFVPICYYDVTPSKICVFSSSSCRTRFMCLIHNKNNDMPCIERCDSPTHSTSNKFVSIQFICEQKIDAMNERTGRFRVHRTYTRCVSDAVPRSVALFVCVHGNGYSQLFKYSLSRLNRQMDVATAAAARVFAAT